MCRLVLGLSFQPWKELFTFSVMSPSRLYMCVIEGGGEFPLSLDVCVRMRG